MKRRELLSLAAEKAVRAVEIREDITNRIFSRFCVGK